MAYFITKIHPRNTEMYNPRDQANPQGRADCAEPALITGGRNGKRYDPRMPRSHGTAPRQDADQAEYVVEFKFSNEVKESLDDLMSRLARHLGVRRIGPVTPRMTVAGPLRTNDADRLVDEVARSANTNSAGARFDGFGTFRREVIFCNMVVSDGFRDLQADVRDRTRRFCTLGSKYYSECKPYSLLDVRDSGEKFDEALSFMEDWTQPDGISLDLAVSRDGKTCFRCRVPFQGVCASRPGVLRLAGTAYVASDTHFSHENVVAYCRRPFRNASEMDAVMQKRWNDAVRKEDDVLFLGDLSYGNGRQAGSTWLSRLNGNVHFLRGNHDGGCARLPPAGRHGGTVQMLDDPCVLEYGEAKFLLTHVPYRPTWWDRLDHARTYAQRRLGALSQDQSPLQDCQRWNGPFRIRADKPSKARRRDFSGMISAMAVEPKPCRASCLIDPCGKVVKPARLGGPAGITLPHMAHRSPSICLSASTTHSA